MTSLDDQKFKLLGKKSLLEFEEQKGSGIPLGKLESPNFSSIKPSQQESDPVTHSHFDMQDSREIDILDMNQNLINDGVLDNNAARFANKVFS